MRLALASTLLALSVGEAAAQICADYATITGRLEDRYGEAVIGVGVSSADGDSILQIWENPETGSWTAVQVTAEGTACVISAGQDWVTIEAPAGEPA